MRVFKIKAFHDWAWEEKLSDAALRSAIDEIIRGLVDANLGGHVYKKRIAVRGRGKRSGVRTIVLYKRDDRAFFLYGFAKNQRTNINSKELKAIKRLAKELLGYSELGLNKAVLSGELIEVR